jgi:phosphonate transport system substrate-binding protein
MNIFILLHRWFLNYGIKKFSCIHKIFLALCLCAAVTAGCTKTEPPSSGKDKGAHENTLLIGLISERNIFEQLDQYEPLADYMSGKTGMKVSLKVLTRYGNVIDNFVSQHLDGAFFGSFTYALAHAKLGVEPVARPEDFEGVSTYYGLMFVRKDSGIRTAKDMKGKTFAFVDRATTAGYLLPLAFFKNNGIGDYRTYLKEAYFTGTHEDAINDVLNKKADIGAAKNTVFYEMVKTDRRIEEELTILARSPDVPQNGLAVRKDLDSSIKKLLRETLLNMHNDEEGRGVLKKFGAKRFIETTDADYKGVYKYIKETGMDLSTYEYGNGS